MLGESDPKRLGTVVRDVVFATNSLDDGLNPSQVPVVDTREEVVFDLQVQSAADDEPEQGIGSKRVAGGHLVLVPVERALLIHRVFGDVVQLAGEGEGEAEDGVRHGAPDE